MRRSVATILALIFSYLLILPAFASSPDASLPPCCRKDGKHHCAMQRTPVRLTEPGISTIAPRCPCAPQATGAVHAQALSLFAGSAVYAGLLGYPAIIAQAEAGFRVSKNRSEQKRGPPSSSLL